MLPSQGGPPPPLAVHPSARMPPPPGPASDPFYRQPMPPPPGAPVYHPPPRPHGWGGPTVMMRPPSESPPLQISNANPLDRTQVRMYKVFVVFIHANTLAMYIYGNLQIKLRLHFTIQVVVF